MPYDKLKFVITTGKYRMDFHMYEGKGNYLESLGNYSLYFEIIQKYSKDHGKGCKE